MPGHEIARGEAQDKETIGAFLLRAGWAKRQKITGKLRWCFRLPTICTVNGEPVLQRHWLRRRIKPGDNVAFLSKPMGGGGNTAKSIMGLVAVIALAAFAPWAGGALAGALSLGSVGAMGLTAAITIGGSLLINALFTPKAGGQNAPDSQVDQIYSTSVSGNTAKPMQPRPVQYGRVKDFSDYASTPWSEYDGNDEFLNVLLARGEGQYQVHQLTIDDTELWNETTGVNPAFTEIEIQHHDPNEEVTLFPINVVQAAEVSGQQLTTTFVGGFIGNAAGTVANAVAVDLVFPAGLFSINEETGNLSTKSVTIQAEYRRVDAAGAPLESYQPLFNQNFSKANRNPIRVTVKTAADPAGRFEVRVKRLTEPSSGTTTSDNVVWASLRSFIEGPTTFPVSTTAIRIKATAQLSQGGARKFGVLQTRKLMVYESYLDAWGLTATRNPIWAFYDAATDTEYGAKRPPSKVDFQTVVEMAEAADLRGDYFDYVFKSAVATPEALDMALRPALCRHRWSGDVLTLVRDEFKEVPQMLLTDREIIRGSLKIEWAFNTDDAADAVVMEYVDEDTWNVAEVQFPPESIDFSSENAARIRVDGVVTREKAFEIAARVYLQALYRRTNVTLDTEHDGRMLGYGSAIRLQTELPLSWGYSGAVIARAGTTLTVDPAPTWAAVGQHYIAIRDKRGRQFGPVKCSQGATTDLIVLDAADLAVVEALPADDTRPQTLADALERADGADDPSFAFGVGDLWSRPCLVVSGRPNGDQVTLTLAVDDERVHEEDLGSIPAAPAVTSLIDARAPLVAGLYASFRQGQMEPILDASWWPAAGAQYYVAEVSYDSGESWTPVYEGIKPSFSTVVDRAALTLRVQAVGQRPGAYSQVEVAAPTITFPAVGVFSPESMTAGLQDYVMNQLSAQNDALSFLTQQIAASAAEQEAANYLALTSIQQIVDNQTAQIRETVRIAYNTANQLVGTYGVAIDVNGRVSGFVATNDGTVADFTVVGDKFQVATPGVPGAPAVPVFVISTVGGETTMALNGDIIADGSITARSLAVQRLDAILANFGDANFSGVARSVNGKMVLDFSAGNILISD